MAGRWDLVELEAGRYVGLDVPRQSSQRACDKSTDTNSENRLDLTEIFQLPARKGVLPFLRNI